MLQAQVQVIANLSAAVSLCCSTVRVVGRSGQGSARVFSQITENRQLLLVEWLPGLGVACLSLDPLHMVAGWLSFFPTNHRELMAALGLAKWPPGVACLRLGPGGP